MTTIQVGIIVGSLRRESINRKIANAIVALLPAEFKCVFIPIGDLALYNEDEEPKPNEAWTRFRNAVKASQALIFCTPEYNRGIPGGLKNAVDVGSRPWGHSVWAGRPTGIVGASLGPTGTAIAQSHLRNVLTCLDAPLMGQPEVYIAAGATTFDQAGTVVDEALLGRLRTWVNRFQDHVKRHTK